MTGLPEIVKRATGLPAALAADVAVAGGILRCGTCGSEQSLGDLAAHLSDGWPQHCGPTMTWVTAKMLAAETREVPDGYELAAVISSDWRVETGKACARRRCRQPSAAELNRPRAGRRGGWHSGDRVDAWYPYCPDHLYGNWIQDGQVMHWILREKTDA